MVFILGVTAVAPASVMGAVLRVRVLLVRGVACAVSRVVCRWRRRVDPHLRPGAVGGVVAHLMPVRRLGIMYRAVRRNHVTRRRLASASVAGRVAADLVGMLSGLLARWHGALVRLG